MIMSRTQGVNLPRLPSSHARVTSSKAIKPHVAGRIRAETRRRSLSEPSYTAYVGTPRQDIPHPIFCDAAMFDDVFDKEGRLLCSRNTPKITNPLNSITYNSLNDPHCQRLFLNNRKLRSHLINLGLITDDLKVVATTREQRQKIRAHELLERKELLAQKLDGREKQRLERLSHPFHLPRIYQSSLATQEHRKEQWDKVQEMKAKKIIKQQAEEHRQRARQLQEKKRQLALAIEEARLQEQAQRNAIQAQQETEEIRFYEKTYGKLANWHRDSDRITNRMNAMKLRSRKKQQKMLSESFPPKSHLWISSQSSMTEEERVGSMDQLSKRESENEISRKTSETSKKAKVKTKVGEKVDEKAAAVEENEGRDMQKGEETMIETGELGDKKEEEAEDEEEVEEEEEEQEEEGGGGEEGKVSEAVKDEPSRAEAASPPNTIIPTHVEAPPTNQAEVYAEQTAFILDPQESKQELSRLLIEAFYSIEGENGTGYLSVEDCLQVLCSRDLGFKLEENEQLYIAGEVDVYGNGIVPYVEVAPILPDLLLQIFAHRAQQSMQQYGYCTEDGWVQIYPVSGGVVYFNKLKSILQYNRPDDFRPYLKDDVFEDSVVDFFETADTDRDGVIDYEDFYNLLASPLVASRVYRSQMEQLLALYQSYTVSTEGRMGLAEFSTVAGSLLLMIYQNAYPNVEEWIELESRKFGVFWLNKSTGETILAQQLETAPDRPGDGTTTLSRAVAAAEAEEGRRERGTGERRDGEEGDKPQSKTKKKKRHKKRDEAEDASALPQLVPRRKSRPLPNEADPANSTAPTSHHVASTTHPSEEMDDKELRKMNSRSWLRESMTIETIPEEDETALEESWRAEEGGSDGRGGGGGGLKEGERKGAGGGRGGAKGEGGREGGKGLRGGEREGTRGGGGGAKGVGEGGEGGGEGEEGGEEGGEGTKGEGGRKGGGGGGEEGGRGGIRGDNANENRQRLDSVSGRAESDSRAEQEETETSASVAGKDSCGEHKSGDEENKGAVYR